jgi:hypothetical protein
MKVKEITEFFPYQSPAIEATNFLMSFALDFDAREQFEQDKRAFLERCNLTIEAKEILSEPNSHTLLAKLNAEDVSSQLLVVLILETVTTDIIVL